MRVTENIEEYLEALWMLDEKGKKVAKISEIAENLKVSPPSAVEMLKKMEASRLVRYQSRKGINLTNKGKKLAEQIARNHRLAELLLTHILGMKLDRRVHERACALEHHISREIADAVCTYLNHPKECPHGNRIPSGACCARL